MFKAAVSSIGAAHNWRTTRTEEFGRLNLVYAPLSINVRMSDIIAFVKFHDGSTNSLNAIKTKINGKSAKELLAIEDVSSLF